METYEQAISRVAAGVASNAAARERMAPRVGKSWTGVNAFGVHCVWRVTRETPDGFEIVAGTVNGTWGTVQPWAFPWADVERIVNA